MKLQTITKILKTNKDILSGLSGSYVGDKELVHISKVFCSIMHITSPIKLGLVYQSCLHLLDTVPDAVAIVETFRKVLANDEFIWQGMSIPIWRGEPVKVTVGIIRATERASRKGNTTDIYFRVLDGLPAGILMQISAPSWWVCKIVKRKLGLFKTGIQVSPADISGTSFQVVLSTQGERDAAKWDHISATQKQKKQNKELINARYNERPCGSSEPCCKCRYTRRQCPLAVL